MNTIADIIQERLEGGGEAFTLVVRFSSSGKVTEYAVLGILNDGFHGQAIGRTRQSDMVFYHALDYVRILEQGDV